MGLKKKLGLGVASAALGLSLVGGGTFAYFSDTAEASGSFAAGTLDLSADPTTVIDVGTLKPGDWMVRSFNLENKGTLDIAKVLLDTSYEVTDVNNNNNGDDFGKHIQVKFLKNEDKSSGLETVIYETTLYDLQSMTPDAVENKVFAFWEEGDGLEAGTSDELKVKFVFVENNSDQNHFQGDSLSLTWAFKGEQGAGVSK